MKISKKLIITILLTGSIALISSCKKDDTGGDAEIHAKIFRGLTPIVGTTTLYVKFGAKTEPVELTTNYDLKLSGEPDDNHVHVEDLCPGSYYLYAEAFDSTQMIPVSGGVAITIKWAERKKMKEVSIQVK